MDAAIAFLKSGNNIHKQNVFSTFGEFYLAGYGKGAAALELWAAAASSRKLPTARRTASSFTTA